MEEAARRKTRDRPAPVQYLPALACIVCCVPSTVIASKATHVPAERPAPCRTPPVPYACLGYQFAHRLTSAFFAPMLLKTFDSGTLAHNEKACSRGCPNWSLHLPWPPRLACIGHSFKPWRGWAWLRATRASCPFPKLCRKPSTASILANEFSDCRDAGGLRTAGAGV